MALRGVKGSGAARGLWLAAVLAAVGCGPSDRPGAAPPQARWHNNQGVVYMDQHNYTRAAEVFRQAIELHPSYAIARANLGIALYSLGRYDSAAVALDQALHHDPGLLQAHYTLGLIHLAQGKDPGAAIRELEGVARAEADDPQVLYYLGQARAKAGQHAEAVDLLRRCIAADPHNVSAHYALAGEYRRLGQEGAWREALETFNRLSQAGHHGVTTSYQGQGVYAEAVVDGSGAEPGRDDAHLPLSFAAAPAATPLPVGARAAATADLGGDGQLDLLVLTDAVLLYPGADGGPSPAPAPPVDLPPGFLATDLTVADLDNDGHADLVVSGSDLLYLAGLPQGRWSPPHFLGQPARTAAVADADHDGDVDLLALGEAGNRLWVNDGSGQFTDVTRQAGLDASPPGRRALHSDVDNDRDVDFFLLTDAGVQLWVNNRDGTFSETSGAVGLATEGGAVDLCVEDFDQDGWMDLGLLGSQGVLSLHANREGRRLEETWSQTVPVAGAAGLEPADFDSDGDLDLLVRGRTEGRLMVWRGGGFEATQAVLEAPHGLGLALTGDFDGDGRTDLWWDGTLLRNTTRGGGWVRVLATGLGSNRDGIGAKVEVKTANRIQKREVRQRQPLLFGLAGADSVEFVRVLWPSGVRQTELPSPARTTLRVAEVDRKGTSCPVIYAWDGSGFRFVSDINGGAIIGYWTGPGQYSQPDTDEYLPLGPLALRDGCYVLQMANQLEEVIYADALELVAVDHPPGVQVLPNERLLAAPPYPPFRLHALRDLRPLRGAWDGAGRDLLPVLSAADDDWYQGFELTDIHGYARDWTLTLDPGDLRGMGRPVLVAYGWVDYAHSTSNWAAAQRGWTLHSPRVEVPDGHGGWVTVCADMGTPAGLPKHMVFDLQGLFPTADQRLRLTTNAAVYWDQFLVGESADVPLQVHRVAPDSADLHWRGYPEHTAIGGTFAFRYHYERLQTEAPWGTHAGSYTRLGPVTELVRGVDDRFAILFHGDELTLWFRASGLPALEPGHKRSFLLYSDGFGKDMDVHSAHSLTVEPLPFHGMSAYPYPGGEQYPQTAAHVHYRLSYNSRTVKGRYR
ncbi:MAG: FG-GAP-like repeat-containing protein [Candidatus Latescibacterota bacterium]